MLLNEPTGTNAQNLWIRQSLSINLEPHRPVSLLLLCSFEYKVDLPDLLKAF